MRLRRSRPEAPGYSRRRCGRGFSYRGLDGAPLTDPVECARIRSLAIPPAWRDVWICADPRGHIQAVGTDAAGRRQYRYHDEWRRQRDREKFDDVLLMAERLPRLRRRVSRDLGADGMGRERVLAAAVRLLDLGCFRIGGEEYANGSDATYGLATLLREHVTVRRDGRTMTFRYPAKGGAERRLDVSDPAAGTVVRALRRRARPGRQLFAYRQGRRWHPVHSGDINDYLKHATGRDVTAKDFRTWHATVLAAVALAAADATSRTGRERAVREAMREVADFLGNTPAVARTSYVDPRVVDLYHAGRTIGAAVRRLDGEPRLGEPTTHGAVERAVLDLLRDG